MYAQVYMHPKIVGLEESIRSILLEKKPGKGLLINFETHESLSDEKFRGILNQQFGLTEIDDLLARREGFRVASLPDQSGMDAELRKEGFSLIDTQDRPMMKDSLGVFLYSSFKETIGRSDECLLQPWFKISPIAAHFHSIHLSPNIWIRKDSDR